eukprot:Skav234314  [mRNA]  locus=scaffold3847:6861:7088:+ [translate_table: standard]
MRNWLPTLQPGGMVTEISTARVWVPLPPQLRQQAMGSTPVPRHFGQTNCVCMTPRGVCITCPTVPVPLHLEQRWC